MVMNGSNPEFNKRIQIGGQFGEEYLIRYDKYVSNTYFNNHDDLPGSSSDKYVYHECPKMIGPQKYLRENYYHPIEYIATTFLTAFMLKRPLNSVVLVITTLRKLERVSNGTDTQVKTRMSNKSRIKMVQRELYNVRDPP